MLHIEIYKASITDLDALQKISRTTFLEAFSEDNTVENMNAYLEESFSTVRLKDELQDVHSEFYFAKYGNEAVGYIKLNFGPSMTELKEENAMEIERIYVLQTFQGEKVGQQLLDKALQIANKKNAAFVWLGVWEKNHRAIQFYKKNGFVAFDKHLFKVGDDEQTDIMMKLILP